MVAAAGFEPATSGL